MSRRLRYATSGAIAALLVAAAALAVADSPVGPAHVVFVGYGWSDRPVQRASVAAASKRSFAISGSMNGLFPGATLPIVLSVFNPNNTQITVTSISTTVGNASSKCHAGYLTVAAFSGSLPVASGQTVSVAVDATMSHSAPNSCEGVVFPLHYSGLGQGA